MNPRVTGTASGLYGSVQMAVAGMLVMLASSGANPALASALVLLGAGIVAQMSFWLARSGGRALVKPESEAASEAATSALRAASGQLVADLGQEDDFLGRRGRNGEAPSPPA